MKKIPLTKGYFAIVDDSDYDELSKHKWYAHQGGKGGSYYAIANIINKDGRRTGIKMHRVILGLVDPKIHCDHVDGNGLNNSRSNIRPCNRSENMRNRKCHENNTSGFKGVSFHKRTEKWQASIKILGKQIYLGLFATPGDAFEAYKDAALELHGKFAKTN